MDLLCIIGLTEVLRNDCKSAINIMNEGLWATWMLTGTFFLFYFFQCFILFFVVEKRTNFKKQYLVLTNVISLIKNSNSK